MDLTQITFYKHQEQQSFACFFIQKHNVRNTCVVVLSSDECSEATQTCLQEEVSFQVRSPELKST